MEAPESMKIVTVIGARPQFIKAAVMSRFIAAHNLNRSSSESILSYAAVLTLFIRRMTRIGREQCQD